MSDAKKLGKLTVGDIADYERWNKEKYKKQLIADMREMYPDKMPDSAFDQIQNQLKTMPTLMDDGDLDLDGIQYLLWLSMKKNDPDVTIKQVGDLFDVEKADEYISGLFPSNLDVKKKPRRRQPVKKTKKKNR